MLQTQFLSLFLSPLLTCDERKCPTGTNLGKVSKLWQKKSSTFDTAATMGRWCYRPHQLHSDPGGAIMGTQPRLLLCSPWFCGALVNIVRPVTGQDDRAVIGTELHGVRRALVRVRV